MTAYLANLFSEHEVSHLCTTKKMLQYFLIATLHGIPNTLLCEALHVNNACICFGDVCEDCVAAN
jgi:hypothetical protein